MSAPPTVIITQPPHPVVTLVLEDGQLTQMTLLQSVMRAATWCLAMLRLV